MTARAIRILFVGLFWLGAYPIQAEANSCFLWFRQLINRTPSSPITEVDLILRDAIPYSELATSRKPRIDEGTGYRQVFESIFEGRRVFVKVSNIRADGTRDRPILSTFGIRKPKSWINEVNWTRTLSEWGIGPKFMGVTITPSGHRAIVTEFAEGSNFKDLADVKHWPAGRFAPTLQLLIELKKIRDVLVQNKVFPRELQLKVTNDGAKVVDTEFFSIIETAEGDFRPYGPPEKHLRGLNDLIDYVESTLQSSASKR